MIELEIITMKKLGQDVKLRPLPSYNCIYLAKNNDGKLFEFSQTVDNIDIEKVYECVGHNQDCRGKTVYLVDDKIQMCGELFNFKITEVDND